MLAVCMSGVIGSAVAKGASAVATGAKGVGNAVKRNSNGLLIAAAVEGAVILPLVVSQNKKQRDAAAESSETGSVSSSERMALFGSVMGAFLCIMCVSVAMTLVAVV